MGFDPYDTIEDVLPNRYQAVLIVSQRARQLNAIRMAKLEMLSKENADRIEIDGRKVTYLALKECLEGKVKYGIAADGEEPADS